MILNYCYIYSYWSIFFYSIAIIGSISSRPTFPLFGVGVMVPVVTDQGVGMAILNAIPFKSLFI